MKIKTFFFKGVLLFIFMTGSINALANDTIRFTWEANGGVKTFWANIPYGQSYTIDWGNDSIETRIGSDFLDAITSPVYTAGTYIEEKTVCITGANASLNNLLFEPNEWGVLDLRFNFPVDEYVESEGYTLYQVLFSSNMAEKVIGSETYHIYRSSDDPVNERFTAYAGEDVYADKGEIVNLIAEPVGEDAIYKWYNPDGTLAHEGINFTTEVFEEKIYQLKVTAMSDGFTASDEVEVKLNPDRIENLYPNPATDVITVDYKINHATNASIRIMPFSRSLAVTPEAVYDLDVNANSITINFSELTGFPTTIYIISLVCNGQIIDSRTFIRY
jgi:hypothetical protein